MVFNFENMVKILEGYFELICLILPSHDIKIEKAEATENTLLIAISRTIETYRHIEYNQLFKTDKKKITYTLSLVVDKQIIKDEEEESEIKPK